MASETLDSALETANRLHRSATRLTQQLRSGRPAGAMSVLKLSILARLHREGEASAKELANHLRIRPQSLTRLLVDLDELRWIRRRQDAEDRRRSVITITSSGTRALVEDIRARRAALAQIIRRQLSPAEQKLLRAAAELMDRLAEAARATTTSRDEENE